jgi:RHS repeat-associated protein
MASRGATAWCRIRTVTHQGLSTKARRLPAIHAIAGDLAGTVPSTGTARYYATDHLGSTRSAWNASKVAVGAYEFTPYGGEYNHTGAALESLASAYTGKPWDDTAQLFHFPYRQYSPDMARWTTRDPLGMVDGPNVYAYVQGQPVSKFDRDGRWLIKFGEITIIVMLGIGMSIANYCKTTYSCPAGYEKPRMRVVGHFSVEVTENGATLRESVPISECVCVRTDYSDHYRGDEPAMGPGSLVTTCGVGTSIPG